MRNLIPFFNYEIKKLENQLQIDEGFDDVEV